MQKSSFSRQFLIMFLYDLKIPVCRKLFCWLRDCKHCKPENIIKISWCIFSLGVLYSLCFLCTRFLATLLMIPGRDRICWLLWDWLIRVPVLNENMWHSDPGLITNNSLLAKTNFSHFPSFKKQYCSRSICWYVDDETNMHKK